MGYVLGIDLGTTFSAAATARDGVVEMFTLGNRTAAIPSLVFLLEDESLLVGEAAERRGFDDPARLAREFKRRVGDETPIMLARTAYSAERLMATVLRRIVDEVTKQEGGPPDHVAIAHPANWGSYKIDLIRQAADLAGLRNATLVTEPFAAAVHYASTERTAPGDVIAVYDLGGGTFDAAILRKTETGFEQLGEPQGIERLGGIDFDESVFQYVRDQLGDALGSTDTKDPAVRSALARLKQECVAAKEDLSTAADTNIQVTMPSLHTQLRLTRPEFEQMIRPLIRETVAALKRVIANAGLAPSDLKAILLVGGSSRIPLVAEMVGQELQRPVAVDAHPKHAIALGAARFATGADITAPIEVIADEEPDDTTQVTPPPKKPKKEKKPRGDDDNGGRSGFLIGAGVGVVALLIAVGVFALAGGGGGGGDDDDGPNSTTTSTPALECTVATGRCAFITDVRLEGETFVADYEVQGFDPIIFEPGVKGTEADHHVHFFFNTTTPANAGTNGAPPGKWEIWDRALGGGELRFNAYTVANRSEKGGDGATELCVVVGTFDHQVEDPASGNCVPLPA